MGANIMLISTVLQAFTTLILTAGEIKSQFTETEPPDPELSIYLSASEARVGDHVTFTCTVTSLVSGTVILHKVLFEQYGKPRVITEMISADDDLFGLHKYLKRFSILKTSKNQDHQFSLSITGVQLEDSGSYGCTVTGYDDLYALKDLQVYRKPTRIYFNHAINPVSIRGNKTLVVVRENETPNITCRVPDIMPKATVTILLEREAIGPKVITADFDVKVIQNIYPAKADAEASIPLHNSYTMEATNRGFKVLLEQDGKTLTCIAKMNGFEEDVVTAEIALQVLYAPKIVCAEIWNATDLVISCHIFANPPVNSYNKTVSIQENGTTVIVRPGEDTPLYSLHDSVLPNTDKRMSAMVFIIKTVTEDHFTNVYTFYAANQEGEATKTILIENILNQLEDGVEGILIVGTRPFSLLLLLLSLVKIFVSL